MSTLSALLGWIRTRPVEVGLVVFLAAWVIAAGAASAQPAAVIPFGLAVLMLVALGRRWPLVALGAALGGLLLPAVGGDGRGALEDVLLAMLVWACFSVGRHARLTRQPWAAAAVLLLLSANASQAGREIGVADVVFPALFTAAPWLLGLTMQLTAQRAEHAASYAESVVSSRHEDIRRATDEERLRIAHELHDVVAHNMSAMSLQAQVARRKLEAGETVTSGDLSEMEESARLAMTDLRRLLGVLRPSAGEPDTTPSESLDDLPELIEHCRHAGQEVRVKTRGTPRSLPPALSLVAYRIIQEALSNARRHGERGHASVALTWDEGALAIRVTNPFAGDVTPEPGHGRLGMVERARLFGGTVSVDCADGIWLVDASLPTPVTAAEVSG